MGISGIIVANMISAGLLLNIIVGSKTRLALRTPENQVSLALLLVCIVGCFAESMAWVLDGRGGPVCYWLNLLVNTYLFLGNLLVSFFWLAFLDLHFYYDRNRTREKLRIPAVLYLILALILLVNFRYPIVFRINENNQYERMPFGTLYFISAALVILCSLKIARDYRKKKGKQRFMFVGLFMVPVALACLVQFLFYGYSVMWAGVAVGLAGATLALHNENAYQDSLTGLLNRTYLDYYLARAAQKKNPVICGIMIDADDFKSINDNFGHSEGDEALKNIARILKASLGKEEIAFRYAGDEFIVLNDTGSAELLEDYCR
ncbi:MAG: GGDEF domain-containing protein, partial [Blautia sp.]|nr:GGDEF domain-containing protein [Blautia sp.]